MGKILLLEDEHYTRRFIKKIILENPLVSEVFDTEKGNEAIRFAKKYQPDIALLDIELDENEKLSGLEVAKVIRHVSIQTEFVFITGYSKYALESFSVHPYDYILKPINIGHMMEVISFLVNKVEQSNGVNKNTKHSNKIVVKNKNERFFIPTEEIIFIEAQNKNISFHCADAIYTTQGITLAELEKQLGDNFARVHKSFIVNKNKIRKIKEVGNRSYYEIRFLETNKLAFMSRNKFETLRDNLISI